MYDNLYLHGFEDSEAVSEGLWMARGESSCSCLYHAFYCDTVRCLWINASPSCVIVLTSALSHSHTHIHTLRIGSRVMGFCLWLVWAFLWGVGSGWEDGGMGEKERKRHVS